MSGGGMRVAVVQHDIVWEDAAATCAALGPQVAQGAASGARLVVLSEMFATGFSMETHRTAQPIDGEIVWWMRDQAAANDVWLAGSVAIRDDDHELPANALLVVGPAGELHRYDKLHPFSYAGEHERFRAGERSVTIELEGLRVGLSVCYDLRFANLYWQRGPEVDVELIVANWPETRRHHWRGLLDARAIENQVYVVACNRVGSGGSLDYVGDSRIVAPDGEVLAAAAGAPTVLVADLDPAVVAEVRSRLAFLPDRREL